MSSIIRKITIEKKIEKDGQILDQSMNYIVKGKHPMYVNGDSKPILMEICNIEESENFFLIYLKYDSEVQLWKKIPKIGVSVEFEIN